jgi:hypothetical protein
LADRSLKVRPEGIQLFRRWALAITREEIHGRGVPELDDTEGVLDWLEQRGMIVAPVDRAQARVLIELVRAGGVHTIQQDGEQLSSDP